ncbi:MAG: hypothetical protein U9R74_00060 [Pseudomonadota bacterium]|nr:hypothetical protein [Pseudomonadota bacterium]
MLIEGPMRIQLVESEEGNGHQLRIEFTDGYRALAIDAQVREMRGYLQDLRRKIGEEDEHSADRFGMLTIQQVAGELLPHIAAGEIPLQETILVDVRPESPLSDFIPTGNA